ncbi:MAG: TraB/GumN family protein [Pseudomonadota bacterium]
MIKRLLSVACAVCISASVTLADDSAKGMVWSLEGKHNTVYIAGSIHLLRKSDYPLPGNLERAYQDAELLLMELDMDDLDQMGMAASLMRMGRATDGETLATLLGEERYRRARELAAELNIDLSRLMAVEPWFAAMTIEQMIMMRNGFDADMGVEMHFTARAVADGKPITGLEDVESQLSMLDGLALEDQAAMLMLTLAEAEAFDSSLDALVSNWRSGNAQYLETQFVAPIAEHPEVYDALLVNRNSNWIPAIEALLDDDDDTLIVVGAAHLVGEDSVIEMLRRRGLSPQRM